MPKGIKGFQKGHGSFWSEETKRVVSQNHVRYWLGKKRNNPEYIKKISESHKGQHSSPSTQFKKQKITAHKLLGGENIYRNLHKWVQKELGKPNKCEFCGKIGYGRQIHWANKSGEYFKDISDWVRLCVKCHYHFDPNRKITN